MGFAILRVEKIKSFGGIGKHIDRGYRGEAHIPDNADESRFQSNVHWNEKGNFFNQKKWLEHTKNKPLYKRVNDRIKEGYTQQKAIRKDAVKALEYLMSSDHHTMTKIAEDGELFKEWMQANKAFLEERHGAENIISISCHFDESTPHVHAVVVPLTSDGRLSAREFVNGSKMLSEVQTKYAKLMSKFGMQRGREGSKRRHEKSHEVQSRNYER